MNTSARDDGWLPALAAAVVLHVLVFAVVVLFGLPKTKLGGTVVPINIVANAPTTDSRAAEQAPETQTAQTDAPTPQAPPEVTPPAKSTPAPPKPAPPQPRPVPPPPKPVPAKSVTPAPTPKPVPTPVKPAPARPQPAPTFDLNRLQESINGAVARAAKPSSAPRGPTRRETAPQPRPSAGTGVSTSDIEGLGQLLNRLWNPNCAADPVDANLTIDVDMDGRIRVDDGGRDKSSDPAVAASYLRAIAAVHKVEPYDPKFRGQHIPIRFNASKACANR